MDSFDIARARADTPAAETLLHFNNAGASLMPRAVSAVLHEYLRAEENFGGYETAEREAAALDNFYRQAARLFNCDAGEIAFMENATRAWDMVFYAVPIKPGDRILTTVSEYGSNVIAYRQRARRDGAEIVVVPDDEHGRIDTAALAGLMDERVKLISISHIPTGGGLVNPVAEVGKIARAADVPFLLDSCQGAGQMPLDVQAIGCDALSGTGRKYLRGPRGTGFLYAKREFAEQLEPPFLDTHAAQLVDGGGYQPLPGARRFENWEQNFAGKAALGAAMEYALGWGLGAIRDRVYTLAAKLRGELAKMDGVTVTDQGLEQCGIITFTAEQKSPDAIKESLGKRAINISVVHRWGTPWSYANRGLGDVARASVHYYNTEGEVEKFTSALGETLKG